MTAPALTRWESAQIAERTYWYPDDVREHARRRDEEWNRQLWYAGLLHLRADRHRDVSVIELGAGPAGLTSHFYAREHVRTVAVEPMPLDGYDREQYALADVELVEARAEDYRGAPADEVWLVNVLQHVEDTGPVLAATERLALKTVRLFEWVHQPTSSVHLHTLTPAAILAAFKDWDLAHATEGRARTAHWSQQFAAYVFERRA